MVSYLVPRNRLFSKCNIIQQRPQETSKWIKWSTFRRRISNYDKEGKHHHKVKNIVQSNQKQHNKEHNSSSKKLNEWFSWPLLFRWAPIGVCIFGAMEWQYSQYKCDKQNLPRTASNFQTLIYCSLPLRFVSKCWGWLADIYIPVNLRPFILGLYSNTFNVNLEEAAIPDLKHYKSISEFFTRPLKDGIRIIDNSILVSPADGKVLHIGRVDKSLVEQVKGITYKIDTFLGPETWSTDKSGFYKLNKNENSILYQCIIYLAPGDYHRFHSPANWEPVLRRHFHGELLSVNPKIAEWLPGLFCVNERAVYVGKWEYGFFSYSAVGATNVGSVKIYIDDKLRTNQWLGINPMVKAKFDDWIISNQHFKKGEIVGQFNMGSTVVLLFEAPINFRFSITPGQTVKVGESIGYFL